MKYSDAILLLDDKFDTSGYCQNQIRSESRNLWVLNSKYGLVKCTGDWPVPYYPNKEDIEADDWELFRPLVVNEHNPEQNVATDDDSSTEAG